jgi:hypothetical protein
MVSLTKIVLYGGFPEGTHTLSKNRFVAAYYILMVFL